MPNYRRDQTPSATWFFTIVAFKRRPIFCHRKFRNSLKRAILRTKENHPFKINAWVLLPDHLHCIWTLPVDDSNFSTRWKLIKQYVSRECQSEYQLQVSLSAAKRKRRESSIWQRRFWEHRVRGEKDYKTHLDYLHFNPVKHGYCDAPSEWRYSSFHRHQAKGMYPMNWAATEASKSNPNSKYGES